MRRFSRNIYEIANDDAQLEAFLYADNEAFFKRVSSAKEEQLRAENSREGDDPFAAYDQAAAELKKSLGYDESMEEEKKEEKDDANTVGGNVDKIDFDAEIEEIVSTSPWS